MERFQKRNKARSFSGYEVTGREEGEAEMNLSSEERQGMNSILDTWSVRCFRNVSRWLGISVSDRKVELMIYI